MTDIVILDSRNTKIRAIVIAVVLLTFVIAWFAGGWQIGDMLSELTQPDDPNAYDVAAMALRLAPADPSSSRLMASIGIDTPEGQSSLDMYREAARSAPADYRRRIDLGRALEQDEQLAEAEVQFKKAVDLAPTYASTHWQLGNFYLRHDRVNDAVAELKAAAGSNQTYRDQVFSLAWDYFNKDAAQIEMLAGDSPEARARLAYFFAAHGRGDDALRNWDLLSDSDKESRLDVAKAIAHGLFLQRVFPAALDFAHQFGVDADAKASMVTNPSFEKNVDASDNSMFGWSIIRGDPRVEISIDPRVKYEGTRSLRVTFKSYSKAALANIFQTIVVEPNRHYRLRFRVRTENLRSAGMPMLEIVNANDDNMLTRSVGFAQGTNDWQEMSVEFTTPANCNGISLRTIRAACGDECPLNGTFWYDDFELTGQ